MCTVWAAQQERVCYSFQKIKIIFLGRSGTSVIFLSPPDVKQFTALLSQLGREIPIVARDTGNARAIGNAVSLAKKLDTLLHEDRKKHEMKAWEKQTSQSLGVEGLDSDEDEFGDTASHSLTAEQSRLKAELFQILDSLDRIPAFGATHGRLQLPTDSMVVGKGVTTVRGLNSTQLEAALANLRALNVKSSKHKKPYQCKNGKKR